MEKLDENSAGLDWLQTREIAIQQAIDSRDLAGLRAWSKEAGGFGSDAIRRRAWPFLLGVSQRNSSGSRDVSANVESKEEDTPRSHNRDATGDSLVDIAALIEEDSRTTNPAEPTTADPPTEQPGLDTHPDERQVGLDTRRSFVYYPPHLQSVEKARLQEELNEVIVTVLRKRKALSYFQGYHDIISVFYLTFLPYEPPRRSRSTSRAASPTRSTARARRASRSHARTASKSPMTVLPTDNSNPLQSRRSSDAYQSPGDATPRVRSQDMEEWQILLDCCDAVSLVRIRDGMTKGLAPVVGYLRLFKRVLKAADPELAKVVLATSPTPYFALSWMLTLFSHDINTLEPVQRIFDFLLSRNPAAVIYLGVAIVLLKKNRLVELAHTLDDDPGIIHTNLALLPPLIADNPGNLPSIKDEEEKRAREAAIKLMEDSTVYPDPDGPNPHQPIILSELFALTDSLWTRFPLHHTSVRAEEIMASQSVIFTYSDLESDLISGTDELDLSKTGSLGDIAAWVSTGPFNEEDVVVVPAPDESEDDEPLPMPTPAIRKPRRSEYTKLGRHVAGRTTLAIVVLVLGLSIAAYQARTKKSLSGLWAFPGMFLDVGGRALGQGRMGTIGSWLVSGKIRLEEVVAGAKQHVQGLVGR
ncbi:GTPase-activating protein gyp8 [Naganishia albida]|nr:GTPase-activating protein gyp8 [Naganishia albida]